MKPPENNKWLITIQDELAAMIKLADKNEDFVLAAKLDDARVTAMQRYGASTE